MMKKYKKILKDRKEKNTTDLPFEVPHQYDRLGKDQKQIDEEYWVEVKDEAVEIVADLRMTNISCGLSILTKSGDSSRAKNGQYQLCSFLKGHKCQKSLVVSKFSSGTI